MQQVLENLTLTRSCGCIICANAAKIYTEETIILKKVDIVVRISDAVVVLFRAVQKKNSSFSFPE